MMNPVESEIVRAKLLLEKLAPELGTIPASVVECCVGHLDMALKLIRS